MVKQKLIDGTSDVVPEEVQSAADGYLKHKRAVAASREKMNAALDALILRMREADVSEMLIDDGEKKLVLTSQDKVKIKARKKAKDGDGYLDEDE